MRKSLSKKTVIIVLTLFLVLSVGYALFSQTVTINGTATAKGDFNIEATCLTTIPDDVLAALESSVLDSKNTDNGYKSETCTVVDDTVNYSVSLEYPGAEKWFAVKLSNTGTINSKMSSTNAVKTLEKYNYDTDELIGSESITNNFDDFFGQMGFTFQKSDGSYINFNSITEEDMEYISNDGGNTILLRTGDNIYFVYRVNWPTDDAYSQKGVYYKTIYSIPFQFEQYNG